MLKNYKKVVSFLTLSLFLLLVLIITSPVQAEMGRARIENNTMVTGDGARLRGGSLWVINNDNLMYKAEWALGDGPWEYINEYKLNSVRVACGYRPDNPDDNFTLDEYEQMLDQIIDRAEQEEIYVIISLRPGGSYKMDAAREFWGSIASRYKDRENVIYELVNAPVGKSNPARYSDDVLRDMEELWGLCDEKAPDTPLIIQSYYTVGESGAYPAEVADNLQGIDWDKTAVGFQSFKIDKSDRIIDLKNKYPCINTEFWFWTTDDEDGEMRPIDGYDRHSTLMEELGISWFGWNIIDRESSRDGLELLVFDALENGVYWDEIKPYIIEQSLDQYVREGTDVSFSAKVYGVPEVEYQWYFNDNAIPGETSSTLKLNNVTNINEGIYTFKVSNYLGSLTSEPAKLELIEEVSFSRPYISDGTLVTGNGSRIRGGTFWLYGNNSDLRSKTDWALSDKPWETMKKYGFNTVRIACGFPSGKYDIYHYEHYLDRLITRAEKEGIYVIVSFRPDTTGSYKMEDARKFWSRIADRYKDRENTIYELVNAPAADLANYTADLLADMEELWEICNNTAPDTPLIILSYDTLGTSGIGPVEVADNLEGIDWSKTAVGFHSFKIDQSDRIVDLINSKYPCINTEFWYHNRRKVMLQIDGYSSHAALMENLETSWLCWDILDTEASLEGLKYTIFDLTDNQVYWNDIEPYILEQSLDQYLREGKNVTFSVKSYGWPQPEFQWFHNGEEISEANASELILDNVTSADEGMYTVELTNNLGTVNSEPAKLELIEEVSLKRPYISNGTLVDGNGNRLRGGTLWIYGSDKLGYKTDWALSDDPWNAMKEAKFNAVRIACGYRPELLTTEGNYDLYQYENYLDRLIARAEKEGIYAVIDFHPDPGDYYMKDALDFWKRIAERYKDRENVIFELINEPSFDLGRSGYSDQLMRDFEELWHLCDEISPDTPIIVLTLAHVGKRDWQTPVEAAERLNGIDWGKTAVGFHSYHRDSSERMVELRNSKYPCINTEFMVGSNVIDGYEFHGTLMELLGISWLQWDIIDNRDKLTKLELVINDLKEKGVYWPDYEGDTGPPSTPQNVNAQAESSTSIKINWDASEDDTWLMGYNIFRDGEKIGATEEANYIDTGLTSGIEYSYTVSAYDFLGYESARSEPASALIEEDKIYPGDLVAYFPFDGSAEDATGNCEVTVVGSLTPAEGKIGQAYIYDGYENYTKVDWDSPIKGDQQSFTITAWIMSTDTSQYLYLIDYSHSHFRLSLQKEELVLHWRYGDDMDHFKLKYPFTEIGVFKHIAVTYNGESQEAHMYINGTLVAEDTSSHPTGIRSIKNPNIGKGFGIIDELRIYDQCLSGAHIRSLINTEDDEAPMVEDLSSWADYYTTYLTWSNPEGHDEEWEKISVVRKEGSAPENPEDGEKVYVDDGTELVDSNLSDGVYHYAVYTCIDLGAIMVYSRPERTSIEVPAIYNKDAVKIEADQDKRLVIGQNTEGDSYGLWNISSNHIGKGPGGKDTGLWIYSAIVGTNPDQVPTGSKILGARLVFNVEDSNFKANEPIEGNSINKAHSINIFRLTDPQGLGLPYYASESGIRVGLDYNYRDHRPGLNVPWVENIPLPENETESQEKTTANILQLLDGETPVDIIEFLPEAYENEQVDTLQFDITTAVQAWADGEDEQGLFISLDQGWINGETLKLSGITAEEEKTRPYIEIIYGTDDNSIDLIPPARVEGLSITPDSDRVTLNWQNPTDLDFEGVKIIRREGIVPFNSQDSDVVTFVDRVSDTNNEYIDTSVEIGKNYYYALYTYDSQHNYGEKVWIKGTPGSTSSAPTLQISSMESGKVELNWDQIEGAAGYRVYREDSKGTIIDKFVDQSSTPGVSVVFIDFVLQGDYTYWVTAVNEYGEGPYSERLSVTVGEDDIAEDVPAEPSNLIVEKVSDLKIGLNWVDNSINETGFVLERKTDDSDWGVIAGTEFNIDSYIDEDLQPGTIYYYRIKAVNSAGESEYTPGDKFIETSNVPVPVTDLSWEVVSANHIKVEWVDTPNEDNYKVELLELAEDGEIIDGEALDTQLLSGNTTYCYFVSLKPGKEYLVRVTSIRGQETVSIESDNIRTSTDPKGGLF